MSKFTFNKQKFWKSYAKGETGINTLAKEEHTLTRPQPQNKDLNHYYVIILYHIELKEPWAWITIGKSLITNITIKSKMLSQKVILFGIFKLP